MAKESRKRAKAAYHAALQRYLHGTPAALSPRIIARKLRKRLREHALGCRDLSATQLRAIEFLLRTPAGEAKG